MIWPDTLYVQYDYDLSDLVTVIRENGANSGAGVLRAAMARARALAFDGASRLIELTQNLLNTAEDVTFDFTHDAAGGIVSRDVSNSAYEWSPLSAATTSYADNGLTSTHRLAGRARAMTAAATSPRARTARTSSTG